VNTPTPALVSERAARRLPRPALLLLCVAYVLPGVFGRDPWRNADLIAFGTMLSLAEGRSDWLTPALGGLAVDAALLPYWLGAAFIKLLGPLLGPVLAARIPFAAALALVLALTWYSTFHLARTEAAQPVPFAFGGEAAPLDYARAIADAAVLALIACLGLLQLGHETTPELVQLFGTSLYLWALAAAPFRLWPARAAAIGALLLLAGSGAPSVSLLLAGVGLVVSLRSSFAGARALAPWIGAGAAAAAVLATLLGAWAWRIDLGFDRADLIRIPKLWLWFMWPAWLLAAWTLWRWRGFLQHRHVAVPAVVLAVALVVSIALGASDRALLPGLPAVAVLAAFALPTLNRSTRAAIDFFSMILFTLAAGTLWVIYASVQTGVPAKPAANVAKLVSGFAPSFSWLALLSAAAATACWIWLVRWRTGRHREAIWKSLVLPAGGVTLCLVLLMTLGLPILNQARSNRAIAERIAALVPASGCIATPGQSLALIAALEHHGRFRVDGRALRLSSVCGYLVRVEPAAPLPAPPEGYTLVARERRPTDRSNVVAIYRRVAPVR
jgi:4-amino-4-deoxy-L-arabinose transferase-like glycosyltransferase